MKWTSLKWDSEKKLNETITVVLLVEFSGKSTKRVQVLQIFKRVQTISK
jgi:hypothetical protein